MRLLFLLLFVNCSVAAFSQGGSASLDDTTQVKSEDISKDAPPVMAKKWNQIHTRFFTLNIGLCILLDHNTVVQDQNSIEQVGKVGSATEFRADRLIITGGLLFFRNPWLYTISANYNGLDAPQGEHTYSFTDWNLQIPFGQTGGWIILGKQKVGVGYEYYSPGSQLFFTERGTGTPALVRQRNIGVRYANSVLNHRLIFNVGAFNNYWETGDSFSENGSQISGRVVYLPQYKSERELLHVGVAYQYSDARNGGLDYSGKPEANTAPAYIKTGRFPAASSNTIMMELVKVNGPLSFVGEYMYDRVSTPGPRTSFNYFQFGCSWFITGENRHYNNQIGVLGKLMPKKNFNFKKHPGPGAFELGARYTYSDFTDQAISGGRFGRFTAAAGWYPNGHFRIEMDYGNGSLNENKMTGNSDFWQFRIQFEL